jgi:hypothetical protein
MNEREIEAEVAWTTFWQFAALPHIERMKRVIAAVDRVRVARGDDEGKRDIMDVFRSDEAMRAFGVDRSPQDEDHEQRAEIPFGRRTPHCPASGCHCGQVCGQAIIDGTVQSLGEFTPEQRERIERRAEEIAAQLEAGARSPQDEDHEVRPTTILGTPKHSQKPRLGTQ